MKKTKIKTHKSFIKAIEPLVKWLNENANPHCKVIVQTDGAELVVGEMCVQVTKFIKN